MKYVAWDFAGPNGDYIVKVWYGMKNGRIEIIKMQRIKPPRRRRAERKSK